MEILLDVGMLRSRISVVIDGTGLLLRLCDA